MKAARIKKEGEYINGDAQEIANKIL